MIRSAVDVEWSEMSGRALLLVEDDEITRHLLTLLLEGAGWRVTSTADGDGALEAARACDPLPAVVLTDLQIPGISGSNLAAALRAAIQPSPIVIAMTATATAGTPQGFDALLVKPFPAEAVAECCASCESRAQPPAAAAADEGALDVPTFEQLRESIPADRLSGLYDFAIADAEARIQKLNRAAIEGDDAQYRRDAHALKGSCGMIGAVRLQRLAAAAEADGIQPGTTLMEWNLLADFHGEVAAIRRILERFLPG